MPIPRLRVCGLSLGESSKKISAIYFISDSNLIWSGHLTSFYSIDSRPDIMGTLANTTEPRVYLKIDFPFKFFNFFALQKLELPADSNLFHFRQQLNLIRSFDKFLFYSVDPISWTPSTTFVTIFVTIFVLSGVNSKRFLLQFLGVIFYSVLCSINCTVVQNSDFIKKSRIWLPL